MAAHSSDSSRVRALEPVDPVETGESDVEPLRPIRAIAFLPSAATLGNLLCGVLAILCALMQLRSEFFEAPRRVPPPWVMEIFPTYATCGLYFIVLAMIFDALDGRLARLARRTTEFGAQLDSLADVVSFGAAPALIYLTLLLQLVAPNQGGQVHPLEWRIGLLGALVFVSCAAIRLARYNAEHVRGEAAQKRFTGMPTPGAAAGFVAILLLREELARLGANGFGVDWAQIVRWLIGPAAFGLGLLMVSRVEHVHVFNVYVRREHPPTHLVALVVLIGLAVWWLQGVLILVAFAYVFSGLVLNVWRWVERRRGRGGDAGRAAYTANGH